MILAWCDGSTAQQWAYHEGGFFVHYELQNEANLGLCIDLPGGNPTLGRQMQDYTCNGTSAQQWNGFGISSGASTALVTNDGTIHSGFSGDCLDAYGSSGGAFPGQIAAINTCNGNPAQHWRAWSDSTVTIWGLCLDTVGGGTASGTKVVLNFCNGAATERWAQEGNALVNVASGLCLDDPGANTNPGTQVQIWTCNQTQAQTWLLPGNTAYQPPAGGTLPCDIYGTAGTPCVAAYSMVRALYSSYAGPLYKVQRATDGATADIGVLSAGGYVNAAKQDSFCANSACTVIEIYDQSSDRNHLTIAPAGGGGCSSAPGRSCSGEPDLGADPTLAPTTIGPNSYRAFGLDITGGQGYRDDQTTGVPVGSQPEATYMVVSGTHYNAGCCMDFGNAETNNLDNGNGHMDADRIGSGTGSVAATCTFTPCNGNGPWVGIDMENGTFLGGNGSNLNNPSIPDNFVDAMVQNNGTTTYKINEGNAQSGGLSTVWDGPLPNLGGYAPMHKEGAIILGIGGDNSNAGVGTWFEGAVIAGYPSQATDEAVQDQIVAAHYGGNSAGIIGQNGVAPPYNNNQTAAQVAASEAAAGTANNAVLHDDWTSVYTVDASNGHLQETYLAASGLPWGTQDLSATVGTPPVMNGTQPLALYHSGFTSVYTVDASNGHLQETYLPYICAPGCSPGQGWATQDLSATVGTPPTNVTPGALFHSGFTSVYTVNASNRHLQETYLASLCVPCSPGQGWATQDLSATVGTPAVKGGTSPVAVLHDGYDSVYTVDASNGDLQETFLAGICYGCSPGQGWATQDLTAHVGTPPTSVTPGANLHSGYLSVYTVNSNGDLQETYLASLCTPNCAPGQGWATQDLSAHVGTPAVKGGTSPMPLYHDGYQSVYTVNAANGQLQETYLPAICAPNCAPGQGWITQNLSGYVGTPASSRTPSALLHEDESGGLNWVSVWTINQTNGHLDEAYLPALGAGWRGQDLSVNFGTPPAT